MTLIMKSIKDKIFVVTGSTGGIGKAICKTLSRNGAIVIGLSRKDSRKPEYITEQLQVDLGSLDQTQKVMNLISRKYGIPDILIHCSGMLIPGEFRDLDCNQITSVVNSNLYSLINVFKCTIPLFETRRRGHFIIIGSMGGIIPMPYSALYSSMKFAVRGFCLSVAEELKSKGIYVTLISPGPVKTNMLDIESTDDNAVISFIQNPLNPKDVARKVLSVIDYPVSEKLIPGYSKYLALILNLFPGTLNRIFPLLFSIGKKGMKKYRTQLLVKSGMNL